MLLPPLLSLFVIEASWSAFKDVTEKMNAHIIVEHCTESMETCTKCTLHHRTMLIFPRKWQAQSSCRDIELTRDSHWHHTSTQYSSVSASTYILQSTIQWKMYSNLNCNGAHINTVIVNNKKNQLSKFKIATTSNCEHQATSHGIACTMKNPLSHTVHFVLVNGISFWFGSLVLSHAHGFPL